MTIKYTSEQLLKLGEPAPEFRELLKAFPALGEITESYEKDAIHGMREKRIVTRAAQPSLTIPENVKVVDRTIPMRDGAQIPVRIYSPANPDLNASPLIVNFHGGGFMMGDLEGGADFGVKMVTAFNAVLVDVNYRLAPEHPFPTPVNDAYDALIWTAANASLLDANPELGFLVTGVSAGANLSAVTSLLARDNKLTPPLTGAFLSAPSVLHSDSVPEKYKSRFLALEQNGSAPILTRPLYDYIKQLYNPDPKSPLFAPLLHPKGFKALPRTHIVACGMDVIRDDAILYEEALREDGVETRLDVYSGLPHCWWGFFPQLEATKKYELDRMDALKWLLRRD